MIVSIRGVLEELGQGYVLVRMGGVGLQVRVPARLAGGLGGVGQEVTLYTTLLVRDELPALYGFPTPQGKRLFDLLLGVSGVGPRHALDLLSVMAPEEAAGAIVSGNAEGLMVAPGIGKRTAARIVVDLQAKLQREWEAVAAVTAGAAGDDVVAALQALGYSAQEAQRAVQALPKQEGLSLEERVRLALQRLARG
ncbi:MAG: Holliday junction branch migration protein RuvA [Chloroflexi bacterium]|nr:Holliday junction branch migration protein RuvA [Chloroflexota bacterium]